MLTKILIVLLGIALFLGLAKLPAIFRDNIAECETLHGKALSLLGLVAINTLAYASLAYLITTFIARIFL